MTDPEGLLCACKPPSLRIRKSQPAHRIFGSVFWKKTSKKRALLPKRSPAYEIESYMQWQSWVAPSIVNSLSRAFTRQCTIDCLVFGKEPANKGSLTMRSLAKENRSSTWWHSSPTCRLFQLWGFFCVCVAVCCSVLQCVALCCGLLQCVASIIPPCALSLFLASLPPHSLLFSIKTQFAQHLDDFLAADKSKACPVDLWNVSSKASVAYKHVYRALYQQKQHH